MNFDTNWSGRFSPKYPKEVDEYKKKVKYTIMGGINFEINLP